MFWPSSGRQAGYEKGDYSPALPLGIGCFGLIFLALGLIASLGLPSLLIDTIKNNVCVLHKENANFLSWSSDNTRKVNVSVQFWKLENAEEFFYHAAPLNISLSDSFMWEESSTKTDVDFSKTNVRFTKFMNLKFQGPDSEHSVKLFNAAAFIAKFTTLNELARFYDALEEKVSDGLNRIFKLQNASDDDLWLNLFSADRNCRDLYGADWLQMKYCILLTENENIDVRRTPALVVLIMDFVKDLLNHNSHQNLKNGIELSEGATTLELLSYFHLSKYAKDFRISSILTPSIIKYVMFHQNSNRNLSVSDIHSDILHLETYVFKTLHIFSNFHDVDSNRRLKSLPLLENSSSSIGADMLNFILGYNASIVLDLCTGGWHLNAAPIFSMKDYNNYSYKNYEKTLYSEQAVPPAETLCPCMEPAARRSAYGMVFNGLWFPVFASFQSSSLMWSYPSHKYVASIGYQDPIYALHFYGLPFFVSSVCSSFTSSYTQNICQDEQMKNQADVEVSIEPYTGAVWSFRLKYQLNVRLPIEMFLLYNISRQYYGSLFPAMIIERNASLYDPRSIKFLSSKSDYATDVETFFGYTRVYSIFLECTQINMNGVQVSPYLSAICLSTSTFLSLGILTLSLAFVLMTRLRIKSKKDAFANDVPNNNNTVDQVNTVKLRKLLGD